jgi:hypothetical protein
MKIMKSATSFFALIMLVPAAVSAQPTTTRGAPAINAKDALASIVTPAQRHAFEASLSAAPIVGNGPVTSQPLSWAAFPGAASYHILRAPSFSVPGVTLVPNEAGTHYVAHVVPGALLFFRVVALGSRGAILDTTSAVQVQIPWLRVDPLDKSTHDLSYTLTGLVCNVTTPSTIQLSWPKPPNADDYSVKIVTSKAAMSATSGAITTPVQTNISALSFTQSGLPAGTWTATVTGNYALADYPVAGQTLRVVGYAKNKDFTVPVTSTTPCQ